MRKKGLILYMICSLVIGTLIGCGKQTTSQTGEVAMGRYIEQKIDAQYTRERNTPFLVKTSTGKLQVYQQDSKGITVYEEQEDLSWKKVRPSWLDAFNDKYAYAWITGMALDANDQPYFSIISTESDNVKDTRTFIVYIEGDEVKTQVLNIEDVLAYIIPETVVVAPNGDIILSDRNLGQCHYSMQTGNLVTKYSDNSCKMMTLDNKLYALNMSESQIDIYNLENDQLEKSIPCNNIDETSILLVGEDNDLYLITKQGIGHFIEQGGIWEELVGANGLSISLPTYSLAAALEKDERFVVLLTDDQRQFIMRQYVYSDTTPTMPSIEINAYSLQNNRTLQEAIGAYQLEHPEVRINLQVGLTGEGEISRNDAISSLNTEILAGKGPDIIVMDGLPVDTYMEKGILADLSGLKEKDQLFPFVTKPFANEKGLYAVPLRFSVPVLLGKTNLLGKAQDMEGLSEYQKSNPDKVVMFAESVPSLIRRFAAGYEEEWFNEKGELQEEALAKFLEIVDTFAFKGEESYYIEYATVNIISLIEFAFNRAEAFQGNIRNMIDLLLCNTVSKQTEECTFTLLKKDGKSYCEPNCIVGVNQGSANKEVALEIVDFMLSEEKQFVDTDEGYPVRETAFNKWMAGGATNRNTYYSFTNDKNEEIGVQWGYEKEIEEFAKAASQIQEAKVVDEALLDLIIAGSKPYFDGEQDVKEVVANMKNQLELYKKE